MMVAVGVYSAFVLYLGWDGGAVGELAFVGARVHRRPGRLRIPVTVFGLGLLADRAPDDSARRARSTPARSWSCSRCCLRSAAGTLGLGPEKPVRAGYFEPEFFRTHGGAIGESLYWASTSLFQRVGGADPCRADAALGPSSLDGHDDREPRPERRRGDAPRIGRHRRRRPRRSRQRTSHPRFRAGTSLTTWISRSPGRTKRRCFRTSPCGRSLRIRTATGINPRTMASERSPTKRPTARTRSQDPRSSRSQCSANPKRQLQRSRSS